MGIKVSSDKELTEVFEDGGRCLREAGKKVASGGIM
jgi:hypothetical protein